MKRIPNTFAFLILCLSIAWSGNLWSHDAKDKLERHLAQLAEDLALTEDQTLQLRTVLEETHEKRREIKSKHRPAHEAMKEEMKSIRAEMRQQLETFLSPEQLEQFDEIKPRKRQTRLGLAH